MRRLLALTASGALLVAMGACAPRSTAASAGANAYGALPLTGAAAASGPSNVVAVTLGETDPNHMFISLSAPSALAGRVTFNITNTGKEKHEFVVLATKTPAANFTIGSFEGENDRINEDTVGTNVGETGDMLPGQTKALVIDMQAGHYAVVCNLPGHYRMGMHEDFTVYPANSVLVTEGEADASHMFIDLSSPSAGAGTVHFIVTNAGKEKHEFVVLQTKTAASDFRVGSFEGENDRINEDTSGTNVGETGDMQPGQTKTLTISLKAGHYAVVCNLPGHYRMGMHQDFTVTPQNGVIVTEGETDSSHMFIKLSSSIAAPGKVSFVVTNGGKEKHEFVVLQTATAAANFPIGSFEGETDRFNEDSAGTNVGETGDMQPGETKTLTIDLKVGHYAVVCNLPGHYRMGMHQDFAVLPPNGVVATEGETDPTHMFISLSAAGGTEGPLWFLVINAGHEKHEFVVLKTDTLAAGFTIGSFEGEADRFNEDTAGTNVGETGDILAGQTKLLTIDAKAGHYAIVCNLPGHYRMGMHQDFFIPGG